MQNWNLLLFCITCSRRLLRKRALSCSNSFFFLQELQNISLTHCPKLFSVSTSIKGRDVDHGRQIKVVNNHFRNNEGLSLLGMPYPVSASHSPLARPWALRLEIFLFKVLRHVVTHPYMTCKRCTIDFIR